MKINKQKIQELLTRGVDEVIVREHLEKDLLLGKPLRVKFGIDPTAPDLHLGHTVPLRKLCQFQELGHQVVLIIGDFTATVGDPSGRSEARKSLTIEQVQRNMKTYLEQAGQVIDLRKAEVHYNSEWYMKRGNALKMFELYSKVTVQRAMERDDFRKRIKEGRDVSMLEVIYPLLQGYDSVMVNASVEIGGTDQKFNLLMGRRVQRAYGFPEQDIMTLQLLEGTDGIRKMSKSFGNYIGLSEPPQEMYAKIMSIPDDLIVKYFRLLTDMPIEEVNVMQKESQQMGFDWKPRAKKTRLAREIVTMYHSKKAAIEAEKEFERVFQKKEAPQKVKSFKFKVKSLSIVDLLVKTGLAKSKSEARRLVEQKGVKVDGGIIDGPATTIKIKKSGVLIQKGKRYFIKVTT